MSRLSFILLLLFCTLLSKSEATTIFSLTGEGKSFVCINRDGSGSEPQIWISPGTEGKYGRMTFGWDDGLALSGVNEKGLFVGLAKTPVIQIDFSDTKLPLSDDKIRGHTQIIEKILQECSNVSDAIALIKKYKIEDLKSNHFMLADNNGESATIEWNDSLVVLQDETNYMLFSNFLIENPGKGNYPCEYYNAAEKLLDLERPATDEFSKSILKAAHNSRKTVYSLLIDLVEGKTSIFYMNIFDKNVDLILKDELAKGEHIEKIASLMRGGIPVFSDLKLLDKRMYYPDDSTPFTGQTIDYHRNGQKKEVRNFVEGIETGDRKIYHNNGELKLEEKYSNGEKNGEWAAYGRTGNKKEAGEYVNDKPTGIWTGWFNNGQKKFEKTYQNGLLEGTCKSWYENGNPEFEKVYKKGKQEGITTTYFETGERKSEEHYTNDLENGASLTYYIDGKTEFQKNYINGKLNGKFTKFYPSNAKEYEESYKDGERSGLRTGWHENGEKEYEILYESGKKTGKYNSWYDNNQNRCVGDYKDGKKDGAWVWYHRNGKVDVQGSYLNGKEIGIWTAKHDNEADKFERSYINGIPSKVWTDWYPNKNLKMRGEYNDAGERIGKWSYWQEDGKILRHEIYEDGSIVSISYYKDGKLYKPKEGERLEGFYVEGEAVK